MANRSSVLDEPPISTGYYEHDTRSAAPEYEEYLDEYTDDYNRLNRPPNYSASYKPSYDPLDKSGGGGGGYYRQPYSQPERFQANYGASNFQRAPYGGGQLPASGDPYSNNGQVSSYSGYQPRFAGGGYPNRMQTPGFGSQMFQETDG